MTQELNINISQYLQGHIITQLVATATKLKLFDHIKDTSKSESELSALLGIENKILQRYLLALDSLELVTYNVEGKVCITEMGKLLTTEGIAYGNALLSGSHYYQAWEGLEYSLKTGKNAFQKIHKVSLWDSMEQAPDIASFFGKSMKRNTLPIVSELLSKYAFSSNAVIADLGSGDGTLLSGILLHYPNALGFAIEQKNMLPVLKSSLAERGMSERCQVICADLLQPFNIKANFFLLKSVLHNWDDLSALQILNNCAATMRPNDRLLVLERVIDLRNTNKLNMAILDLTMLVLFGSKDRETIHYRELLKQAGLYIQREFYIKSGILVLEASIHNNMNISYDERT